MIEPEFSRLVDVSDFEDGDSEVHELLADESERAALAGRFGLASLDRLAAEVALIRRGRQTIARARVVARAEQMCVVSLEPIEASFDVNFEVAFDPDVRATGEFDEFDGPRPGADDPPEPLVDGAIDLGEMVAERFGLLLDPYPRKAGAEVDPRYTSDSGRARENPFEVLKGLEFDG